jgi:hypothetical protein
MVATDLALLNEKGFWWHKDNGVDRHRKVSELVDRIRHDQAYVDADNMAHLRAYSKRDYYQDSDGNVVPRGASPYLGVNATKSAVDTITAKVTQQDPRPQFKTEGGDWGMRQRARKLQKFIDGVFYATEYYSHLRRAFKDACIFGTGFLKPYFEGDEIKWERVWPGDVVVDEASALNGSTRSMFQVMNVPVESLLASYPKKSAEIMANNFSYKTTSSGLVTSLVRVYEAWHLPDCDGKNGRHVICTDSCTLLDEDYDLPFEPIYALRWSYAQAGYYGHGAVEDVTPLQEEMDYIMQRIQVSTHNCANVWLLKHVSDTTPNSQLTNRIASIVEWSGNNPPTLVQSKIMDQQVFDHVKWLNELIYNVTGVSVMSATSQKPKGIESGVALQTMLDIESQRFAEIQKAYEQAVVRCAEMTIALASRKFSDGKKTDYQVRVDSGRYVETIKWSEVSMDDDEFVLKVWPTNMLPASPAGKMEWVERMMQAGLIDALTGMMLLDFPDVEAHQSLLFSAVKQALWVVDQVVYESKDIEPKEWYDIERCIKYMQMALSNAEMEGAPEEVYERGMDFIAKCHSMIAPPEPQMPMGDPGMGEMPPEMGMGGPDMGAPPPDMGGPPQIPGGMVPQA